MFLRCETLSKQRWNFPAALFQVLSHGIKYNEHYFWLHQSCKEHLLGWVLSLFFCTYRLEKGVKDYLKKKKKKKKTLTLLRASHFASHTDPCSDFSSSCESWITRRVQRETWIRSYYINSKCSGEPPFAGPALFLRSTRVVVQYQTINTSTPRLLWCIHFYCYVKKSSHIIFKESVHFFFLSPPVLSFETLNILLCFIQSLSLCPSVQKEDDGNVHASVS